MSSVAQKKEKVDTSDIFSTSLDILYPPESFLRVFLINPKTNLRADCGKTAHNFYCLYRS